MNIAITVIAALIALVLGLAAGYFYRKNAMEKKIGQTEEYAKNLLDDATRKAEEKKKEAVLEAKEETLARTLLDRHIENILAQELHLTLRYGKLLVARQYRGKRRFT